jgi:hypothetical protein
MALSEGRTGAVKSGEGAVNPLRFDDTGAVVVSLGHSEDYEVGRQGEIFIAANQSGVTTQAGLSATTPVLTLYNPAGSNKIGLLKEANWIASVAFAAASVIWLGANTNVVAAAVTGTDAIVRNSLLGNSVYPALKCFTAATLPAAPVAIAILGVGLTGAITTVPWVNYGGRKFRGGLQLLPGSAVSFQTSTASGATGFFGEFIWEEVDA